MTTTIVPIEKIVVEEERQRKFFPDQEKEDLKDSILAEHGLMTPLLVRPRKDGKYTLVAGERRLRAIAELQEEYNFGDTLVQPGHAPVVIRFFETDLSAAEAELHENVVRLNLTWQEQAEAIARLHRLKQALNPDHGVGMTAALISDIEEGKDYAAPAAYRKVNQALLVTDFMHDPEVMKAKDLHQASKIVSRKLEEEQLARLTEIRKTQTLNTLPDELPEQDKDDLTSLLQVPIATMVTKQWGTFYHGDMEEKIKLIPDGSVNLVITDPPYGMGVADFDDGGNGTLRAEYSEENFRELHQTLVKQLDRICAEHAHVYIFCDIDYYCELRGLFSEGWRVRRKPLIWSKGNMGKLSDGLPVGYRSTYEFILYATRGSRPGSKVSNDIIVVADEGQKVHHAQKPVALYKELMSMSAYPGDTVLDAFAGSGVIFKAAREMMLNPIGIELNDKFAEVCRMAQEYRVQEWDTAH